jgi:hypothetical protein
MLWVSGSGMTKPCFELTKYLFEMMKVDLCWKDILDKLFLFRFKF